MLNGRPVLGFENLSVNGNEILVDAAICIALPGPVTMLKLDRAALAVVAAFESPIRFVYEAEAVRN
jgi:hypothetical protein